MRRSAGGVRRSRPRVGGTGSVHPAGRRRIASAPARGRGVGTLLQATVIGLLAFATLYAGFLGLLLFRGRREEARALAGFVPDCVVLFRRLLGDERLSRPRKLLLLALVGYLAMPLDLVPDFIPVAGQLDDAILVALVLRAVLRGAGPALVREHWPGPAGSLNLMLWLAGYASP